MAIQMYKGKVSEIVDNRDVRQHLEDGWTFTQKSQSKEAFKHGKDKITAEGEVKSTDLPKEDLDNKEK